MSEDDDEGIVITRDEFEQRISRIIDDLIYQMDYFLRIHGYTKENIDQVLFVGGCTRVPLIRKKVEEYFGKGKISMRVDADTCVAEGATLYAINKVMESKTTLEKTSWISGLLGFIGF